MKNAIRKITLGSLCVALMAVTGIASAGDWPLSGVFRPLVHAPVRVVVAVPACPPPPCRERVVIVPEVVVRERYGRHDYRHRDWR